MTFVSPKISDFKIILGSQSPRRKEILSHFDFDFSIENADIDEKNVTLSKVPQVYVEEIAKAKATHLEKKHPHALIITADTTVFHDGEFFCKPESKKEAFEMLKCLSGKKHIVSSAMVISYNGNFLSDYENTFVTLRELSDDQIHHYIEIFSPFDKAGGYGIQDGAGILIQKIEGNFHNVLGFEVKILERLFSKIGINLWHYLKKSSP